MSCGRRMADAGRPTAEENKTKHRPQTYRKEWEKDPNFKGWLKPVDGVGTEVFCRCCNTEMMAEITVIKNHAKSKKHQEKKQRLLPAQKSLTECLQKTTGKA